MKKNCIKSILSLRLFAVVLLLSVSSSIFGQELIREAYDFYICDTSIIRLKSNDTVVICNRNHHNSTFMLVSSGLSSAPTVYLDSVYVNDFELFKSKIYFCGYKYINNVKKAIFGRFNFNYFPSFDPNFDPDTNLDYYVLDTCKELKKLDLFQFFELGNNEIHLVMTGTTGTRLDALVEASYTLNYPTLCRAFFSTDETENIDDVVVTDNHVVVSTRKEVEGIPVVVFRRYPKPYMLSTSIFTTPVVYTLTVTSPIAETPVYLEHRAGSEYAAVYKVRGFYRFAMLELLTTSSNINCIEIFGDEAQTVHPTEIKYNGKSHVYDILARNESAVREEDYYFYPPMQIYHITPAVSNGQASYGDGTWYRYEDRYYHLWSIDPLKSSDYFVASGAFTQIPRMFRYKHDEWEECPDWFEYRFDVGSIKGIEGEIPPIFKKFELEENKIITRTHMIPFPDRCGKIINQED